MSAATPNPLLEQSLGSLLPNHLGPVYTTLAVVVVDAVLVGDMLTVVDVPQTAPTAYPELNSI